MFLRNRQKVCLFVCFFCPDFILTRVKISLDKNTKQNKTNKNKTKQKKRQQQQQQQQKKNCKAFYTTIHVSTECFLTFVSLWLIFIFLTILAFFAKTKGSQKPLFIMIKFNNRPTFHQRSSYVNVFVIIICVDFDDRPMF